jgi:hypothetical protein
MNESKTPSLILATSPKDKISLPDSFFEKEGAFFNLLKNPSYLRYAGWNLRTLNMPRLKNGEFWEVTNGDRKIVRLYSDGSFITLASIGPDFLGWRQEKTPAVLHALATIEFIYEFVELYRLVLATALKEGIKINACRFKVGMRDLITESEKLKLRPYEANTWGFMVDSMGEIYEVETDFIKEESQDVAENIFDPKYVAYKLVGVLFRQFGVPLNMIPYAKADESGKKFIDIDKIKRL